MDRLFQDVHIESPGPSARGCIANLSAIRNTLPSLRTTRRSTPSQPSEYSVDPQPLLQRSAQQTTPAQPSCRLPSRASPIVYTHIRSLRGIMASRYHYSANTATQTHALALGPHTARYLAAHGYTQEAVDTIIHAYNHTSSGHEFALQLSQHGLAMAEALYIWHLIHL